MRLARIELRDAGAVLAADVPVLCVSPEGRQVLTGRVGEVDRLHAAGWYLYADAEVYEKRTGENAAGEVLVHTTGVDVLYAWVRDAKGREDLRCRIEYGKAWARGQVRLGVLAAETAQKVVDFLQSFEENTAI